MWPDPDLATSCSTTVLLLSNELCVLPLLLQEVDHMGRPLNSKQQQVLRPFIPAGRKISPDIALKGQTADLLADLESTLSKDWPQSFIKVSSCQLSLTDGLDLLTMHPHSCLLIPASGFDQVQLFQTLKSDVSVINSM
jgi:hypothetical protein